MDARSSELRKTLVTETNEPFEALTAALTAAGWPIDLAELHGGLCGVLCAGGAAAADVWLDRRLAECDRQGVEAIREPLQALQAQTWRALTGTELEFEPLLPAADRLLTDRVEALALWCHGFVAGLADGGVGLGAAGVVRNEEIDEIVRDFVEISKVDPHTDDADELEESDFSYTELTEFVRVAVQIVFEELGQRPYPSGAEMLH